MSDLLFAYGTFRHGFSRHGCLLRLGLQLIRQGTIRAEVYDLGDIPGARRAKTPRAQGVGEIYRLPRPEQDLKVPDRMEGFGSINPHKGLFRCELAEVRLESHASVQAWVYWLDRWHGPKRRLASGDYTRSSA